MKRFFLVSVFAVISVSMLGKAGDYTSKAYRGCIEAGALVNNLSNSSFELLTVHGCDYGDGAFLGVGLGLTSDFRSFYMVPLFGEIRYSFQLPGSLLPFASLRVGGELLADTSEITGGAFLFAPGVGLGLGPVNIRLGYRLDAGNFSSSELYPGRGYADYKLKLSSFEFGIALNF